MFPLSILPAYHNRSAPIENMRPIEPGICLLVAPHCSAALTNPTTHWEKNADWAEKADFLYWSTRWSNVGAVCSRTFTRRSAVANRTYRFHDVFDQYKKADFRGAFHSFSLSIRLNPLNPRSIVGIAGPPLDPLQVSPSHGCRGQCGRWVVRHKERGGDATTHQE